MIKAPSTRETLAQIAVQLVATCGVLALLVSALGPALDHHFAERHPGHAHVYLGPEIPDHVHSYETGRAHFHTHGAPFETPSRDGVVYLTAHDGSGQGMSDLAAPAVSPSALFHGWEGSQLPLGSADHETALQGTSVPPPIRPPLV